MFSISYRISSLLLLSIVFCATADVAFGFTSMSMAVDPVSKNSRAKRLPNLSASTAVSVDLEFNNRVSLRSRMKGALGRLRQRRVEVVEDIEDFQKIIDDKHRKDIVAVMFYSPVCKACQAAKPIYQQLAQKYTQVRFISVPMTKANSSALQSLGVSKFPFGQIYSQEGLVDELGLLRKLIPSFEDKLQSHIIKSNNDEANALGIEKDVRRSY